MTNDSDDDHPSFEDIMADKGVVPLDAAQPRRRGRSRKGSRRPRSIGPSLAPAPGAAPPSQGRETSSRPAVGPAVNAAKSQASRNRKAVAEPAPSVMPQAPVTARQEHLQQALAAARNRIQTTAAEVTKLRATLVNNQAEMRRLDADRRRLEKQCHELSRELAALKTASAQQTDLRTVCETRGLRSVEECIAALHGLLHTRAHELLDALVLSNSHPLAQLLDQRIALVHNPDDTALGADCVVVPVPPERCEITGGSDIRGAFRQLLHACRLTQARVITIVGGSPAYRQQLRNLAQPYQRELRLNLVSGTQRRTRRRAEADIRTSDLVVIWGATELDHSVSAVYTGNMATTVRVPHRGISRMLEHVAATVISLRP